MMETAMNMQLRTGTLAVISGVFADEFRYSHRTTDRKFYSNKILVKRNSGAYDMVPIIIPENKLPREAMPGMFVEVRGTLRSNKRVDENGFWHLDIFVYPHYLKVCHDSSEIEELNCNQVMINARISRISEVRETPFGRLICDFMLTNPKESNPDVYYKFPCIAWGRTAMKVSELPVNTKFSGLFRFQSREYFKRVSPNSEVGEKRIAYELSLIHYTI